MTDHTVRAAWRSLLLLPTPEAALAWIRASLRAGDWPRPGHAQRSDGLWERAPVLFKLALDPPEERHAWTSLDGEPYHRSHAWPTSPSRKRHRGPHGVWWWPYRQVTVSGWVEIRPACDNGIIAVGQRLPEHMDRVEPMLAWLERYALAVVLPRAVKFRPRCSSCKKRRQPTSSGVCVACSGIVARAS